MFRKICLSFVIFLLPGLILFSQIRIDTWSLRGNEYRIILNFDNGYNIEEHSGVKYVTSPSLLADESNYGEFKCVQRDVFIQVPFNCKPTVNISELKSESIDAMLSVNPKAISINDSTLQYVNYKEPTRYGIIKDQDILGYFQYNHKNYLHLRFFPIRYDVLSRKVKITTSIAINLKLNNEVYLANILSSSLHTDHNFVDNTAFDSSHDSIHGKNKNAQWIKYGSIYLKFSLSNDGVYRMTYDDLIKQYTNIEKSDPQTFQLFYKGNEIPIVVHGEDDQKFDAGDYIEFIGAKNYGSPDYRKESVYGQPYNEYLDRYTDSSYYWLTWGDRKGKRILPRIEGLPIPDSTLRYYYCVEHFERNQWFDFLVDSQVRHEDPNWTENKTWLDETQQSVGTFQRQIGLKDIYPNRPGRVYAKIQSYASNIVSHAHRVGISFNSVSDIKYVTDLDYAGQKVLSTEFNSSILKEGDNSVDIYSLPTNASLNVIRHDWYEFEYPRYLRFYDGQLIFGYGDYLKNQSYTKFVITQVPKADLILYRSYDGKIIPINNYTVSNDTLTFRDTLRHGSRYYLFDVDSLCHPKFCYAKVFDDLSSSSRQAEYIVITHPDFLQAANNYADFIKDKYAINTTVINAYDIYDQYNFGFFSPEPIRTFVKDAYFLWSPPKPKYLFLIGDACYDYYGNRSKYGGSPLQKNFVPSFGAPVSDNWFATWDSTKAYIPNLLVGRLPINSSEELKNYQNKHRKYFEDTQTIWNKTCIFFSGGDSEQYQQIKDIQQGMIDNYIRPSPYGGYGIHFYKTMNPNTNFGPYSPDFIQSKLDVGGLLISYLGHSGTQTWDNGIVDANQLVNKYDHSPLVTDFGCSTAKFAEPDITSFSEDFVVGKNGQAIGYIGNSSLGFTSTSFNFPSLFFKKIFKEGYRNIAEAQKEAKLELLSNYGATGSYGVFALTNTLIGDPIISLPIPTKPNLSISDNDISYSQRELDELVDSLNLNIVFRNNGIAEDKNFTININDQNNNSSFEKNIRTKIPLNEDTLKTRVPLAHRTGIHNLVVTLDSGDEIEESITSDNKAEISFVVSDKSMRSLVGSEPSSSIKNPLTIINSPQNISSNTVILEYSSNKNFVNSSHLSIPLDSLYYEAKLDSTYYGRRLWFKLLGHDGKLLNEFTSISSNTFANIYSDSISMTSIQYYNTKYFGNSIRLDSTSYTYEVISGGTNDGETGIISLNKQNYIPENVMFGYHVCVFNNLNHFKSYKNFNLYLGGAASNQDFINFLDQTNSDDLVIIVINGDGGLGLSSSLRNKFKEFGSEYADSIAFRSSWAFIGKKNAPIGSRPETFRQQYHGKASVSITYSMPNDSGNIRTDLVKILGELKSIIVNVKVVGNSRINCTPITKLKNGEVDTLSVNVLRDGLNNISLSNVNQKQYIQLLFNLHKSDSIVYIRDFRINYSSTPELIVCAKKKSTILTKDTLNQGEPAQYFISLTNAGEVSARNIDVKSEIVYPDNHRELIDKTVVDSLKPKSNYNLPLNIDTKYLSGNYQILLSVDDQNNIDEFFKDNNYSAISLNVKANNAPASLKLTFDGTDIINGDYVSSTPDIKVELNDLSLIPISDTNHVQLYLNNKRISLSHKDISYSFSSNNPKFVLNYKPTLSDGTYTLKVLGTNATGQVIDSAGVVRQFLVSNQAQLLYVYNYPNPFSSETFFTFKLTQIPDELRIKIFTISGRMIKELAVPPGNLNYDFNRIEWDGRDSDGDLAANGVYLYKIILKKGTETIQSTQKLAIVR